MALGRMGPRGARRSDPPGFARRARLPVRRHPDRLPELPRPRRDGLSLGPRHAALLHGEGQGRPDRGDGLRPGGGLLDWQTVQPKVVEFARVCSYDRSGIGWSESGTEPRTSPRIVKELHALLSDAGEEGPYVLVGHSFGGANVQLYASEYPEEVAGMVLVDSALDQRVLDKDLRDALAKAAPSPW
jgi:pimeloyl-ACP methyl ester carboxylesterase